MRVGDSEHRLASAIGAYRSWANTTNRAVRMAPANAAGPNSLIWHAKKRFGPEVDLDTLTNGQRQQCEADQAAWQLNFRRRGLQARKRKTTPRRTPATKHCATAATRWRSHATAAIPTATTDSPREAKCRKP